jgi:hypothetical protein
LSRINFSDVLKKISTWPVNKIDHLLPSNWKPPQAKSETAAEELAA